jgi:peptidoglycan/xylan/chitin deacetylase (PgdA/CDA1 family)
MITAQSASPRTQGLAAFSVDFDTLARDLFRPPIDDAQFRRLEALSFERTLPRLLDWLDQAGIRITVFVIGRHAVEYRSAIHAIAARGHELGNHTFSHRRDFARLDRAAVADEIARGTDAIGAAAGRRPVGFRAPGYTISPHVVDALVEQGYQYDASVVPSWMYSATKQIYRLCARDYREYLHPQGLRCALAPQRPYRIDRANMFGDSASSELVEVPQTTVGPMQFPLIYGLYARLGPRARRAVDALALRRSVLTVGFHDLEFADARDLAGAPVGELTRPHTSRPIDTRLAMLSEWIRRISWSHSFGTLREVAAPREQLQRVPAAMTE